MELSPIFSDGMVLQRGRENRIWGRTKSHRAVTGIFGGISFGTRAERDGRFEAVLPLLPTGGPYELQIGDGLEEQVIRDVMVGDVFLLGGQSNMELPVSRTMELLEAEIEKSEDGNIRMLEVPKEYFFEEEERELSGGSWSKAEGEALQAFSAAGFFMAHELRRHTDVPIGLLQTAVGGTPAKAWCSRKTIRQMGLYCEELDRCSKKGYPQKVEEQEMERENAWRKTAQESFQGEAVKTGKVTIPGIWKTGELSDFRGAIRLKKTIHLTKEEAEKRAELVLGAIIDADRVYVNGVLCGVTEYKYPPRFYPVPQNVLKEGENVIEIQMYVFREHGGFMPGKRYGLRFDGSKKVQIELEGQWDYEIMCEMETLPDLTFFTYMASALYQGMLVPIRRYQVCCALFYQGESNVECRENYVEEMKALIADWRELVQQKKMPFIYVQLAGFSDGEVQAQGEEWAKLRAEQEKVLEFPQTAMVSAIDIGEYNDLHPMDKKTLGERLALAVRGLVYRENVVYCGPTLAETYLDDENVVHLCFDNAKDGLQLRGKEQESVKELELKNVVGKYIKIPGKIVGNEVLARLPGGERPIGVRYAWRDCPMEANLYNKEGLPALPFRRGWES